MAITARYDEEGDVLYVSIDSPRPALTENLGNGLLLRRDPASAQWVGVTIVDFLDAFAASGDLAPLRHRRVPSELVGFVERLQQHPEDVLRFVPAH